VGPLSVFKLLSLATTGISDSKFYNPLLTYFCLSELLCCIIVTVVFVIIMMINDEVDDDDDDYDDK